MTEKTFTLQLTLRKIDVLEKALTQYLSHWSNKYQEEIGEPLLDKFRVILLANDYYKEAE
jgi:hypothetical protein